MNSYIIPPTQGQNYQETTNKSLFQSNHNFFKKGGIVGKDSVQHLSNNSINASYNQELQQYKSSQQNQNQYLPFDYENNSQQKREQFTINPQQNNGNRNNMLFQSNFQQQQNYQSQQQFQQEQQDFQQQEQLQQQVEFQQQKQQQQQIPQDNKNIDLNLNINSINNQNMQQLNPISDQQKEVKQNLGKLLFNIKGKKNKKQEQFSQDKDEFILYGRPSSNYNFLQIPPDYQLAVDHAFSRTASQPIDYEEEHKKLLEEFEKDREKFNYKEPQQRKHRECPCCSYKIDRTEMSMLCDTQDLKFLGSGFPLFYNYILWCIYLLVTYLITAGGYELYSNLQGDYCSSEGSSYQPNTCRKNIINQFSLANRIDNKTGIEHSNDVNTIMLVIMMIMMMLFRRSQDKMSAEIDEDIVSPADYTIHVMNIPKGLSINYRKELKNIFQDAGPKILNEKGQIQKLKPVDVTLVYDITYVNHLKEDLEHAIDKYKKAIEKYGVESLLENQLKLELVDAQIEIKQNLLRQGQMIREIIHDPSYFAGQAFVSFETEQDKTLCLEQNKMSLRDEFDYIIDGEIVRDINNPKRKKGQLYWDNHKLLVQQAYEPDDVNWEGIYTPEKDRFIGKLKGYVISFFMMVGCFAAVTALSVYQMNHLDNVAEDGNITEKEQYFIQLLSIGVSILIFILNLLVEMALPYVVGLESPPSRSLYNASFASKYAFLSFLNSAVLTLLITIFFTHNYYGRGGFIYTQSIVFFQNTFMTPILNILNKDWIQKYFEKKQLKKQVQQNECIMTQRELNQAMEDIEYFQAERYADILNTMWLTFFYAPCIPIGIVSSILNMCLIYYTDKFNLLRMCSVKEVLSHQVSQEMIELMEYIIILYASGSYIFESQILQIDDNQSTIMVIVGLIYSLAPMQLIAEFIFNIQSQDESTTYSEAQRENKFETDYSESNPISQVFTDAREAYESCKKFDTYLNDQVYQEQNQNKNNEQDHNNSNQGLNNNNNY